MMSMIMWERARSLWRASEGSEEEDNWGAEANHIIEFRVSLGWGGVGAGVELRRGWNGGVLRWMRLGTEARSRDF